VTGPVTRNMEVPLRRTRTTCEHRRSAAAHAYGTAIMNRGVRDHARSRLPGHTPALQRCARPTRRIPDHARATSAPPPLRTHQCSRGHEGCRNLSRTRPPLGGRGWSTTSLVDGSLDPSGTQLVSVVLIMVLAVAALRDDIESLTLAVSDRACPPDWLSMDVSASSRAVVSRGCRKPSAATPKARRRE